MNGRRTLTHFHAFHDEERALPSLAKHNTAPQLWISKADADARQLANGDAIKIYNKRGLAMGGLVLIVSHLGMQY